MTKPLILALALAGLSTFAFAQDNVKPVAPTPATIATAAAPTSADAAGTTGAPGASGAAASAPVGPTVEAAGALVNPFNGKPLNIETLQRELEVSRYRSQLLEEQLKQANVSAEIKNVPVRKAVEAAQARTQEAKETAQLKEIEGQAKAAAKPAPVPEAERVVKKSPKALAKEKAEAEAASRRAAQEAAALAAQIPPATLLSVISVGGKSSVVLDIRGSVATIADGENSPAGPVKVLNGQSASVGGRTLKVHDQTIGRYVVSDAKPAPVGLGSGGMPSGMPVSMGNVTALPPSIPQVNSSLPPPPLPAGAQTSGSSSQGKTAMFAPAPTR